MNLRGSFFSTRLIMVTALMSPCVMSWCVAARGTSTAQVIPTRSRPALAFAEHLVNFGPRPVDLNPVIQCSFRFAHRGVHDVRITKLDPSCQCVQAEITKMKFAPGEHGRITLRVNTAREESGQQEYLLHLHYSDPEPREIELAFKVVLPELQVAVRPSSLIFYQLSNRPATQRVVVADYRPDPLTVVSVESSSPLVTTQIGHEAMARGEVPVVVTVAGDFPTGSHRVLVTVHTDDVQFSQLQIPILVESGSMLSAGKSHVRAVPDRVVIEQRRDRPSVATIELKGHGGSKIEIDRIECAPPFISAGVEPFPDERDQRVLVRVSLHPDMPQLASSMRGLMKIHFAAGSESRLLEVPVEVRPATESNDAR